MHFTGIKFCYSKDIHDSFFLYLKDPNTPPSKTTGSWVTMTNALYKLQAYLIDTDKYNVNSSVY